MVVAVRHGHRAIDHSVRAFSENDPFALPVGWKLLKVNECGITQIAKARTVYPLCINRG